jgi:phosphomevalonate kinase
VAVAVIAAIEEFYEMGLSRVERFKLAMLTTIQVAPAASGGDVATSTFGGWIAYTSPDREALRLRAAVSTVREALTASEWDLCKVRRLPHPPGLRLLVGWTGSPASTERLVTRVKKAEPEFAASYATFLDETRACVADLIAAWEAGDTAGTAEVLAGIRRARLLLQGLGKAAGSSIETAELEALCETAERHGGAAKPSGAGGGDCGIVLLGDDADTAEIFKEWELGGIRRLSVSAVAPEGSPEGL